MIAGNIIQHKCLLLKLFLRKISKGPFYPKDFQAFRVDQAQKLESLCSTLYHLFEQVNFYAKIWSISYFRAGNSRTDIVIGNITNLDPKISYCDA